MPKGSTKEDENKPAASLTLLSTEATPYWRKAHLPKALAFWAALTSLLEPSSVQSQQGLSGQLFPALVGTWLSLPIAVHAPPTSTRRDMPCVPNPSLALRLVLLLGDSCRGP